jgi:hypothetical protein
MRKLSGRAPIVQSHDGIVGRQFLSDVRARCAIEVSCRQRIADLRGYASAFMAAA